MEDAWSGLFLICSSNPSAYLQCVLRIHKETFRSKTTVCKPSIHTGEENKPLIFCTTVSWIRRSFTSFSRETQNFVFENPTEGMDDACSGLFLICSSNPSVDLHSVETVMRVVHLSRHKWPGGVVNYCYLLTLQHFHYNISFTSLVRISMCIR